MARANRRSQCALALAAAAVLATGAAAAADDETAPPPALLTLDDLGGAPEQDAIDVATSTFNPEAGATEWKRTGIRTLETVETEDEEVTVTLASDILFDSSSAALSQEAARRVGELVADIAEGETVRVDGHTDSVDTDEANEDLSERRARAVADVVAEARPDLTLEATGYGESELTVPESGDDIADDRAQNRRVEIRYTGTTPGESSTETDEVPIEPVDAPYSPGAGPTTAFLDEDAVVATEVVEMPETDGGRVRLGVEELVVRGPLIRLRVQMTPLDPVPGLGGDPRSDRISVGEMAGNALHPLLVDTGSLTSYEPASHSFLDLGTNNHRAKTVVDRPLRYELYFPRPVDDSLEALDVTLVPTWPTFEDVPIRWD